MPFLHFDAGFDVESDGFVTRLYPPSLNLSGRGYLKLIFFL
jgi:hypothetical protein